MDMKSFENLPIPKNIILSPKETCKRATIFCKLARKLGRDPKEFADYLLSELNGFLNDFVVFEDKSDFEKRAQFESIFNMARDILGILIIGAPLVAALGVGYMMARSKEIDPKHLDKLVQSEYENLEYDALLNKLQQIKKKKQ